MPVNARVEPELPESELPPLLAVAAPEELPPVEPTVAVAVVVVVVLEPATVSVAVPEDLAKVLSPE
jgi:hypothetical protein